MSFHDTARRFPPRLCPLKRLRIHARYILITMCTPGYSTASNVDFVVDVLLLQRGCFVSNEVIEHFGLPFSPQFYCRDWVQCVASFLSPEALMGIPDLREHLLVQLNSIMQHQRILQHASNETWSKIACKSVSNCSFFFLTP